MASVKPEKLVNVTNCDTAQINKLLKQLSPDAESWSAEHIFAHFLRDCNSRIFVLRDLSKRGRPIVGMASVHFVMTFTAYKAHIEDVVVLESYRGRGLGEKLLEYLLSFAASSGIDYVDLTSNPKRVAANALYLKLGFKKRDTNCYRHEIQASP